MCLSLSLSSFPLCSFSFIFPPPPIRSHVCTPRWRSHSYRWILCTWILMDIDRYWWILVDVSPPPPIRSHVGLCGEDAHVASRTSRGGGGSAPTHPENFEKKCFDYTSWSYCFYSAFISELMFFFHITSTFDPFGSLSRTDYMFVFSKDQRLRYTKENMAVDVLEGYETSEIFCFWLMFFLTRKCRNEWVPFVTTSEFLQMLLIQYFLSDSHISTLTEGD